VNVQSEKDWGCWQARTVSKPEAKHTVLVDRLDEAIGFHLSTVNFNPQSTDEGTPNLVENLFKLVYLAKGKMTRE